MAYHHLKPKWLPWKLAGNQNFVPDPSKKCFNHCCKIKVWWRELQPCWKCSSSSYRHSQWRMLIYSHKHLDDGIPPPDGQMLVCFRYFDLIWEARYLPTCDHKCRMKAPANMLRVFITLSYIHTIPTNHLIWWWHLTIWNPNVTWKLAGNQNFAWDLGQKPANMRL